MRELVLALVLVLMASGAQASSYLDIFGGVHDPIFSYVNSDYGVHYSGPDLQPGVVAPGAFLEGAILNNANLAGANLSGANLTNVATLNGANLSGANLSGAYMDWSYFRSANLEGADLSNTHAFSTNFNGANLSNADLSGAYMPFSTMNGANLSNAELSGTWLGECCGASMDLTGTNLTGANLSGAILGVHALGLTIGTPNYDALTDFTNAYSGEYENSPLFDPVAAGWTLVPEPNTALLVGIGLAGIAARRRPQGA